MRFWGDYIIWKRISPNVKINKHQILNEWNRSFKILQMFSMFRTWTSRSTVKPITWLYLVRTMVQKIFHCLNMCYSLRIYMEFYVFIIWKSFLFCFCGILFCFFSSLSIYKPYIVKSEGLLFNLSFFSTGTWSCNNRCIFHSFSTNEMKEESKWNSVIETIAQWLMMIPNKMISIYNE